ncbi:MAG TPA: 2-dehydro-3-deoxy-6-phosphogalactonate aldolase [Terracidiphilus sp.]|jgi:2-dehydro-3-deoxyphosphogalactonate aldolase|nr:2-dehydro-3-deoxy-6-phosphogalactonate aldolase [Terracidiphilus sp.]
MVIREWLRRCPLIAILRGIRTEEIEAIFDSLLKAGVLLAEVPINSPQPFASIERAVSLYGDRMLIGAGTVVCVDDARAAQDAGARFIVMPHADAAIVQEAKRLGMQVAPGVGTATEAFAMVRAGADALKLFPADVVGPKMVSALRAVLPADTALVPVGGVDRDTIAEWKKAGVDGYGVGSALYKPGKSGADVEAAARALLRAIE